MCIFKDFKIFKDNIDECHVCLDKCIIYCTVIIFMSCHTFFWSKSYTFSYTNFLRLYSAVFVGNLQFNINLHDEFTEQVLIGDQPNQCRMDRLTDRWIHVDIGVGNNVWEKYICSIPIQT